MDGTQNKFQSWFSKIDSKRNYSGYVTKDKKNVFDSVYIYSYECYNIFCILIKVSANIVWV